MRVEAFTAMSLSRFKVSCSFPAWNPGDRGFPHRQVSILPGTQDLFTEDGEPIGAFVKFLKNGSWYEAERSEFARSTVALIKQELEGLTAQRGA
jgi:hypothetical protein